MVVHAGWVDWVHGYKWGIGMQCYWINPGGRLSWVDDGFSGVYGRGVCGMCVHSGQGDHGYRGVFSH